VATPERYSDAAKNICLSHYFIFHICCVLFRCVIDLLWKNERIDVFIIYGHSIWSGDKVQNILYCIFILFKHSINP
jgi:hypothetical protein